MFCPVKCCFIVQSCHHHPLKKRRRRSSGGSSIGNSGSRWWWEIGTGTRWTVKWGCSPRMWVMYELNHFMFYLSIHLTSIFVSYVFIRNHKIQPLAMGMLPHVIPMYTHTNTHNAQTVVTDFSFTALLSRSHSLSYTHTHISAWLIALHSHESFLSVAPCRVHIFLR